MKDLKDIRLEINDIDQKMADLFAKRMALSKEVAEFKKAHNLPIYDASREEEVINRNLELVKDEALKKHYVNFLKSMMNESKRYQAELLSNKNNLRVNLGEDSYDIHLERGSLAKLKKILVLHGKTAIIADDLIPEEYVKMVKRQIPHSFVIRFKHGEENKNIKIYQSIVNKLIKRNFDRHDSIVALGGGVTSDLAGYVAATYMRGVHFYIIPTTLLSQVDASIGGKVAINYGGYKNLVGAFYQPKKVIIDPDTLATLPERLFNEGLAEVIKMAATCDKDLFALLENSKDIKDDIEEIIFRSLLIKKSIVEEDEKEADLRKVLNFGHTYGHAIEALCNGKYYHGECVAMGMLYFSSLDVRKRIEALLKRYDLPHNAKEFDEPKLKEMVKHDKKAHGDKVVVVTCNEIGTFDFKEMNL